MLIDANVILRFLIGDDKEPVYSFDKKLNQLMEE